MSEHAWALENIETYTAGGLDPGESERLEQHVAACPACTQALEQARSIARAMDGLFQGIRPGTTLEERLILCLRNPRQRHYLPIKILAAVAAVLFLGMLGWYANGLIEGGDCRSLEPRPPIPGRSQAAHRN